MRVKCAAQSRPQDHNVPLVDWRVWRSLHCRLPANGVGEAWSNKRAHDKSTATPTLVISCILISKPKRSESGSKETACAIPDLVRNDVGAAHAGPRTGEMRRVDVRLTGERSPLQPK